MVPQYKCPIYELCPARGVLDRTIITYNVHIINYYAAYIQWQHADGAVHSGADSPIRRAFNASRQASRWPGTTP